MEDKSLDDSAMVESSEEFEAMYQDSAPRIYRFMFWRTKDHALAEDLTSSVFEKAWQSRANFKGGTLNGWLYRIANNTLIDYWRKKKTISVEEMDSLPLESEAGDPALLIDQQLSAEALAQAVNKLPKQMRLVVKLRFIEGLSARKTGERLGLSEANVRVIQYRALRILRGTLK